jgi:hypothetical protein
VVQALGVTTIGQVVTTGQELMRIVPANTPVQIEAYVTDDDIGFVSPGQSAVVKIDSFPFTRYGTLEATVEKVASDAVPAETANRSLSDPTNQSDGKAQKLAPSAAMSAPAASSRSAVSSAISAASSSHQETAKDCTPRARPAGLDHPSGQEPRPASLKVLQCGR